MTIKWFTECKELHSGAARSVWMTPAILELFSAKAAVGDLHLPAEQ